MKTRGPNPNPTAQAQSKRCLPLSTKTQNIIKILPAGLPQSDYFGWLFEAFSTKVARGVQGHTPKCPQDTNMDPKSTQMEPKGAAMKPQGLPKVPKSLPTVPHVCQNGSPRCHNGAPRPPKVPKRHHKALQSATKTPKEVLFSLGKTQGAKKHVQTARGRVLAEGGVDPAAGRGTTHQAACRRPRSGAEAENRGSSNKGFVLILK